MSAVKPKETLNAALPSLWNKRILPILASIRYALHVIVHPFDGFWDLKHEKRGTFAGATAIVVLTFVSRLLTLQYASFLFVDSNWENVNVWAEIAKILVPLSIWCIANWCLTTLFDGKGTMRDIYIMTGYALTPYPLINIPLTLISNLLISGEGAYYTFFSGLALVWCGILLVCGLMMTHEYTLGKTILSTLATIVAMLVIVILCLMIFSMASEAVGYFASIWKEIILRLT